MPELGNLLQESKRYTDDPRVKELLEQIMEFEKGYSYSYKSEIRDMLSSLTEKTDENH